MIKTLCEYDMNASEQIYTAVMALGFLMARHKGDLDTCIVALEDAVGQYQNILGDRP